MGEGTSKYPIIRRDIHFYYQRLAVHFQYLTFYNAFIAMDR